jgi:UDPglucose 6-dehydrogenase
MNISIVGLGKLGLSMAAAITNKGHCVTGVDISPRVLDTLAHGKSPIDEPYVQDYLTNAIKSNRFRVTADMCQAIHETNLTFVAVNTPEQTDGSMDLSQASHACRVIGEAIKDKHGFHVVVVNSTIIPQASDNQLKPILEEASKKQLGVDFGYCVNPVWIALTTVVQDFTHPPVIVVGASDKRTADLVSDFYKTICDEVSHILRTTPLTAEIIKMAHNAFATAKMAFVNEIADACTHLPGADIRDVTNFFKMGGERSGRFFEAGMGFGGPCFPRDLQFFTDFLSSQLGDSPLLESIQKANDEHGIRIVDSIERELNFLKNKRIAVLGLSYKPNTSITERSFSLRFIELLLDKGAEVRAYDPKVQMANLPEFKNGFYLCEKLENALEHSEAAVIATPWKALKELPADFYIHNMKRSILFDPWRLYDVAQFQKKLERYVPLGLSRTQPAPIST